jgi:hypothetical protein
LATEKETQPWSAVAVPGISAVALSPDERWCLVLNPQGASCLFDVTTGRHTSRNLNLFWAETPVFSPDGKLFAADSSPGCAGVWETTTWQEVRILHGFQLGCHSVAFSPDGKRLAAGSNGQEAVRLWDIESYQELLTLEGQGPIFGATAFSPDGKVLGSRNARGILHLWRAPSLEECDAKETGEPAGRDLRPQSRGEIKEWLVLSPIALAGSDDNAGLAALDEQQIPGEANLRPRAGEPVKVGATELGWKAIRLQDHLLDFNVLLGDRTVWSVAYAVCYLQSDTSQAGLVMKIGSDDWAKVYLNGAELYRNEQPRSCTPDEDFVAGVQLEAGVNRLVLKVVNGRIDWQASVRFTDAAGQPVKGLRVTLNPEGNERP